MMSEPTALLQLLQVAAAGSASESDKAALLESVAADPVTEAFRAIGMEPADRAAERLELLRRTAALCPRLGLEVAGLAVKARLSLVELWRFYLPMVQALADLTTRRERRALVGITGPGGSGKSVFALLLQRIFQTVVPDRGVALCPLDGFHYPNAYLDTHFANGEHGEWLPLRSVKGSPPSFDVSAFVRTLRRLSRQPSVSVPRYDRRLHDPVQDGHSIGPDDRLVLVEGNYLLLNRGAWSAVGGLLDLRLFLVQSLDALRGPMVARHVRGGRSEADAGRYFERVDAGNFEIIAATAARADLLVRRNARQQVTAIETPADAS